MLQFRYKKKLYLFLESVSLILGFFFFCFKIELIQNSNWKKNIPIHCIRFNFLFHFFLLFSNKKIVIRQKSDVKFECQITMKEYPLESKLIHKKVSQFNVKKPNFCIVLPPKLKICIILLFSFETSWKDRFKIKNSFSFQEKSLDILKPKIFYLISTNFNVQKQQTTQIPHKNNFLDKINNFCRFNSMNTNEKKSKKNSKLIS